MARIRVERVGAVRRPLRDHEQVLGQAPGRVGLEHVVLEDEVLGVGPVVRDLPRVVVAHHVHAALRGRRVRVLLAGAAVGIGGAAAKALFGLRHEAVHRPSVDVGGRIAGAVRAAVVEIRGVMKWRHAGPGQRIGDAHAGGNAVGAGIGPEVGVEGPVLLHDDHDVLDLVDPGGRGHPDRPGRRDRAQRARAGCQLGPVVRRAGLIEPHRDRIDPARSQRLARDGAPAMA